MSVYTTEVRYICESESGLLIDAGYNDIDEIIDKSWNKIFKNFPIFNESYRETLCKKILSHYYTREIGAETVGLWKLWLNRKMAEIMPYYNKLYETEMLKYDPLNTIDFTRTYAEKSNSESLGKRNETKAGNNSATENSTNCSTEKNNTTSINVIATDTESTQTDNGNVSDLTVNKTKKLHSDTPQGSLQNLEDNSYLSDADITNVDGSNTRTLDTTNLSETKLTTDDSTDTESTTENNTNASRNSNNTLSESTKENNNNNTNSSKEVIEKYFGKNNQSSYASLINEYRESLLNIDLLVILDLSDLFINIY